MKQLLFTFILLFVSWSSFSQEEFSFTLYFEDAVGNKDSLILGYDEDGTQFLDEQFGEVDISNEPWDSVFEVRASENILPNPSSTNNPIYYSKKQIVEKICTNSSAMHFDLLFNVYAINFPITISWDGDVFSDSCNIASALHWGSVFSDWHWGCCPTFMSSMLENETTEELVASKLVLEKNDFGHYYMFNNDSIFTYRLSFSHYYEIPTLELNDVQKSTVLIYPNPFHDMLFIENNHEVSFLEVYNLAGMLVFSKNLEISSFTKINLHALKSGVYFVSLIQNDTPILNTKLVKY